MVETGQRPAQSAESASSTESGGPETDTSQSAGAVLEKSWLAQEAKRVKRSNRGKRHSALKK